MLAFGSAAAAIEWAVVLQLALLRVQWSQELLQTQAGSEAVSQEGLLLFRGLRARCGIYHGEGLLLFRGLRALCGIYHGAGLLLVIEGVGEASSESSRQSGYFRR